MSWLPIASTTVAVVAALGGAFGRPRRAAALGLGAAGAALVSLAHTAAYRGPGGNDVAYWLVAETPFLLVVVAQAVRRPSPQVSAAAGSLTFVAISLSPLRIGLWQAPPAPVYQVVAVCGFWAVLAAAAVGVGGYLRWTDRAREQAAIVARREQRVQLARDLHDWFSHEVTGIVLEAQAGQLGSRDPAEAARSFKRIEDAGVRALDAMDRALRLLRNMGDPAVSERLATVSEIAEVASRFAERSAARVDVSIDDGLDALQPEVAATVHRVVMEALTNVRRHAVRARTVGIRVVREGAELVVSVTDDGDGRREGRLARKARHNGAGLAGLAERVEVLGGRLHAGRAGAAGWTVRAVLPVGT